MFEYNESLEQARARNVRDALLEDTGIRDWTAELIPAGERHHARVIVREPAILCGQTWFEEVFRTLDHQAVLIWHYRDGEAMPAHAVVVEVQAQSRALLTGERPALNFIQMMSAVATQTRAHVDAIAGISRNPRGCAILDTRKTLPGLRQAQKYAVRCGGGANQRMALWHGILIKENHISAAGGIPQVLAQARALQAGVDIQIEVENLAQLQEALAHGAQSIMLDNFALPDVVRAVELNAGRALLEVSGGVELNQLADIAATGVDRISIGKLTKDVRAVDFSMRVTENSASAPSES